MKVHKKTAIVKGYKLTISITEDLIETNEWGEIYLYHLFSYVADRFFAYRNLFLFLYTVYWSIFLNA